MGETDEVGGFGVEHDPAVWKNVLVRGVMNFYRVRIADLIDILYSPRADGHER